MIRGEESASCDVQVHLGTWAKNLTTLTSIAIITGAMACYHVPAGGTFCRYSAVFRASQCPSGSVQVVSVSSGEAVGCLATGTPKQLSRDPSRKPEVLMATMLQSVLEEALQLIFDVHRVPGGPRGLGSTERGESRRHESPGVRGTFLPGCQAVFERDISSF